MFLLTEKADLEFSYGHDQYLILTARVKRLSTFLSPSQPQTAGPQVKTAVTLIYSSWQPQ